MSVTGSVASIGASAQDIQNVENNREAVDASALTGRHAAEAVIIFGGPCVPPPAGRNAGS